MLQGPTVPRHTADPWHAKLLAHPTKPRSCKEGFPSKPLPETSSAQSHSRDPWLLWARCSAKATCWQSSRDKSSGCQFWMHDCRHGLILYPLLPPLHPATTSNRAKILWSEPQPLLRKNPEPRDAVLAGAERCPLPTRACRANKGGSLSNKRSKGMKYQDCRCLHLPCRACLACKALPLVLSPIYTLSAWEMGDRTGRRRRRED